MTLAVEAGWLPGLSAVVGLALGLAWYVAAVVALGLVPANRKPAAAMAWLLLIFAVPVIGILLFLLLGGRNLGRARHLRQAESDARIRAGTETVPPLDPGFDGPTYVRSVATLNRNLGSLPSLGGNSIELFTDYRESIAAMTAAVQDAERFVHVEFYISAWDEVTDPFFAALVDATDRGVVVRVLFDHLGSKGIPGYKDMVRRLGETRVDWRAMLPVEPWKKPFRRPDLRNHRKILVVDGHVAFMGSQNLVEPGYNKEKNHRAGREWVELTSRVRGPVVAALDALFHTDWYSETGQALTAEHLPLHEIPPAGDLTCQVIPSGPGYSSENNLRAFTTLIHAAQRRLSLTSPYFVPDESLLDAVTTAAHRGVEVELFVSEQGDQFMVYHAQCSYYRALLEAGVRIYLYQAPFVLHSKHFSVDDDVAVLGSSNMDMRSFALNYEVSLMVLGTEVVHRMRKVEDGYRALSRELTLDEWSRRPALKKYVDNVMRLTAALQ
ncbi:MAG TPA: cardiolipin synthase [Nocardioides sp.]|uniref:cardiolipin synthase n=1 Tax=Nocardioides sp. TaxID=35761 RepID=UPI002D7E52BA|nr:cardiolipin synthase [Nocardioides sp.]HET6654554.1 cardiolipin synthase [Nocardioides sp.]